MTKMHYKNKYNAKKVKYKDLTFDSRAEFERYMELCDMKKRGKIGLLELQPRFLLLPAFECDGVKYRKIEYIADFRYCICENGIEVIEDVKGVKTDVYKLKIKLFANLFLQGHEGERIFREVKMTGKEAKERIFL